MEEARLGDTHTRRGAFFREHFLERKFFREKCFRIIITRKNLLGEVEEARLGVAHTHRRGFFGRILSKSIFWRGGGG